MEEEYTEAIERIETLETKVSNLEIDITSLTDQIKKLKIYIDQVTS